MKKNLKHLIGLQDYSTKEIKEIVDLGEKISLSPEKYSNKCHGKILATLFYEPSTRTKFSFESAMLRLGGNIIGFSDANTSSVSKGESVADTIRVMSFYADIAVMRHPKEGAPKLAAEYTNIPIINAGDGGHLHPTQTLTDLLTIQKYKGSLENHVIGLCGDLKYGRTVHSLIKTMARFNTKKFVLISPEELMLPNSLKRYLKENYDLEIIEVRKIEEVIEDLDILYMTRIQRERFFNEEDYLKLKDSYILTKDKIKNAKKDMIIMHPLPRVNEIAYEVDEDKRAIYFNQAKMGLFVRMALIMKLLEVE
ncbi:aspartate carbamoyltransferase [Caminicella sporogenes DSM 14501]|uniref:Aspartate carbamoyltransferase n=1 Tax=Caminicella sporogenes DSM 14501 TaxID=1121266 RepID=A0A1M6QWD6_9FIRM|nr:aspartate carbamoyltransferase [Caminicella sporogenes]RKD20887.1 aspartate carbamoyltransferase [Caminicella sporogenes]SHK24408.1 aspartate carbamoyltransferase [Caminicella sporogenes DSM 14501]